MLQLIANGAVASSFAALAGLGFWLTLRIQRYFNFSYAAYLVVAPYAAFALTRLVGLPFWLGIAIGIAIATLVAVSFELAIVRPVRRRREDPVFVLLASIGFYVIVQNTISITFGDPIVRLRAQVDGGSYSFFDVSITGIQISLLALTVATYLSFYFLFWKTPLGLRLQAVSQDPQLAVTYALNVVQLELIAAAISGTIAGLAGVLIALDVDLYPTVGVSYLIPGVAAAIIAGQSSPIAVASASLIVGYTRQGVAWVFGAQWSEFAMFLIILIALFVRFGWRLSSSRKPRGEWFLIKAR